jgi:hypothetical protein
MKDAFTGVVPRAADLDMGIAQPALAPGADISSMVTAVAERQ